MNINDKIVREQFFVKAASTTNVHYGDIDISKVGYIPISAGFGFGAVDPNIWRLKIVSNTSCEWAVYRQYSAGETIMDVIITYIKADLT